MLPRAARPAPPVKNANGRVLSPPGPPGVLWDELNGFLWLSRAGALANLGGRAEARSHLRRRGRPYTRVSASRGPHETARTTHGRRETKHARIGLPESKGQLLNCLARPGFVRRRSFSRSPAGLVNMLTPEQTRSLSSSFAAFTAETKARTRSPCSPLNDSPVPPMPRLLGKRPRS